MRVIAIIAAALVATAGPAWAQTAPDAERQVQLDRAERYLELAQGSHVNKLLRRQLEDYYGDGSMPPDQQAWLTENMTVIYEDVLELALAEVRDDVADSFTGPELDALIAFYDTPLGRSIINKEAEIGIALQEAMMPHLMTRMATVGDKFCQRFDCSDMGGAAAKRGD